MALGLIVNCFEALPDHLNVQPITRNADVIIQRVEVEADEMASFVQQKANKQWIWLTMAAKSHQTIDFHVGDRSRDERPAGSPLAASAGSRVSPVAVERLREIAEVEFADIVVEA